MMTQDVISFVVRFVRETDEAEGVRWRGRIQHVQSHQEQHFARFSEALAFMHAQVGESVGVAFGLDEEEPANPFLDAARVWGEWLPQFNRQLMEQMMAALQSGAAVSGAAMSGAAVPEQMRKTMDSWLSLWAWGGDEAAAQRIAALEAKVAALKAEVANLKAQQQ